MPWKECTYERVKLYEEVWLEPVRTVAKRYGISDVALAKICRKLDVPIPGRGYWAKRAAGENVEREPLPKSTTERLEARRYEHDPLRDPPTRAEIRARMKSTERQIVVPPTLEQPHPFVKAAAKVLKKGERNWQESCLDISVSPDQLDRGLRIMDALLKAMVERGLSPEITPPPTPENRYAGSDGVRPNTTRVLVEGQWLSFRLVEKRRESVVKPPPGLNEVGRVTWSLKQSRAGGRYQWTGRLELMIAGSFGRDASFRDGKKRRLEACLTEVLARFFVLAEQIKHREAERDAWQRSYREAEQRRLEEQEKARIYQEQAKELRTHIDNWVLAKQIREYVEEVRGVVATGGCAITDGGKLDRDLKWALAHADRIDPLRPLQQEMEKVRSAMPAVNCTAPEESSSTASEG